MILSFTQKLNDKPTYFVEKILASLHADKNFKGFTLSNFYNHDLDYLETAHPKIHTIRTDLCNRWKAGNDIHFTINPRTKNQFQFAPIVKCISTQLIWIQSSEKRILVENYLNDDKTIPDKFNWKQLQSDEVYNLIKNDGFDSEEDFWNYFDKDFSGKIIHWTNLKY
jgi:hypothetical protein